MKETLAEAEGELTASRAGSCANDCMTIRLLVPQPVDIRPAFTLQYAPHSSLGE
jgi:hypothetical protein